jgi:hypothetical protein
VNVKKFDPVEIWRAEGGLLRRDNGEFAEALSNPDWRVHLQTVAERLTKDRGYFDRLEVKSRGRVGVLQRRCCRQFKSSSIGKETHQLLFAKYGPEINAKVKEWRNWYLADDRSRPRIICS